MPEKSHHEIHYFLEARRKKLQPQDVGLVPGQRRRTPGLRREEVALLANVSLSWYTRFEQGKTTGLSIQAVGGIARALRLTPVEHRHLLMLAGLSNSHVKQPSGTLIAPRLVTLMRGLSLFPAFIVDEQWNFIAWNDATVAIYGDFDMLPQQHKNILGFMFLDLQQKSRVQNWIDQARSTIALFRARTSTMTQEAWFVERITYLKQASPDFAVLWNEYDVEESRPQPKCIIMPDRKEIKLDVQLFAQDAAQTLYLIVQTPHDQASEAVLLDIVAMSTSV